MKKDIKEYKFEDIKIIEESKEVFEKRFIELYEKGYKLDCPMTSMEFYGKIVYIGIMIKEVKK
jgi:hypothetical protein